MCYLFDDAAAGGAAPRQRATHAALRLKLGTALPIAVGALAELYLRLEDTGVSRNLLDAVNVEGLTPVTLAVSLGKRELFEALWGERAKQIWTFGASAGVCAYLYPLDGIDDSGDVCDENEPLPDFGRSAEAWSVPPLDATVHNQTRSALFEPTWRSQGFVQKKLVSHDRRGCNPPRLAAQAAVQQRAPEPAFYARAQVAAPAAAANSALELFQRLWQSLGLLLAAAAALLKWAPKWVLTRLKWQLKWWLPLPYCVCAWRRGAGGGVDGCWRRQRARQLTCEDVLVRYEKWEMLEPMATDERVQKQFSAGAASLAALGLSREWRAQGDIDEGVMERKFSSYLQESNHWLHVTTSQQAGAGLDGSRYVHRDSTSVMEQLSECKWARLYAPRFTRLFFFRLAAVVLTWAFLAFRATFLDGTVPAPGQPMRASSYSAYVLAFVVLTGLLFFTHLVRFLVLGLPPLLKRLLCTRDFKEERCLRAWRRRMYNRLCCTAERTPPDRNKERLPPNKWCETPETTLYVSAHSGRFGVFHVGTLLLGSGLLFTGGCIDFEYGLGAAGAASDGGVTAALYASGSFFFSLHLIYFALGWEYTGPLLVMVFSVITTEAVRWIWLVLPILLSFAFPFFFLAAYPAPGAAALLNASAAANATAGPSSWLSLASGRLFGSSLGVVVDQGFNPYAGSAYLSQASGGGTAIAANSYLVLAGWLGVVFILSITLMSLLVAMFSKAFDAQSERGADFLIERLRAEMMLESLQTYHERFHVRHRDKSFLLNKTLDVLPSGHRLEPHHPNGDAALAQANTHRSMLLHRPYFLNKQPMPLDAANATTNRVLAKKALSKQALSTSSLSQALQNAHQGVANVSTGGNAPQNP